MAKHGKETTTVHGCLQGEPPANLAWSLTPHTGNGSAWKAGASASTYVTQYETGNEAPRTVYKVKVNTAQNGHLRRKWEVGRLNSLLHKRPTFTSEEVVFGAGEEMKEKFQSVPQVRPRSVFQLAKDKGWSSVL